MISISILDIGNGFQVFNSSLSQIRGGGFQVILENNLKEYKKVIDVIAEIVCDSDDSKECGKVILSYADGGIEYIWEEYLAQRVLDLPRIYHEITENWVTQGDALIEELKTRADATS